MKVVDYKDLGINIKKMDRLGYERFKKTDHQKKIIKI